MKSTYIVARNRFDIAGLEIMYCARNLEIYLLADN